MGVQTDEILDVLRERGIEPWEERYDVDFPGIGRVEEGETIYSTSIAEVFREPDDEGPESALALDDRLNDWWREIERIISAKQQFQRSSPTPRQEPPEPHCAWYCPIHFFGHAWGIYIRELCILSSAVEIAQFVDWRIVPHALTQPYAIARQLLRSAFYVRMR